jgi:D-sedoheptulose 7-phosphate isomerase
MLAKTFREHLIDFTQVMEEVNWTTREQILTVEQGELMWLELLERMRREHGAVYVMGNGGSAAIAAHVANDLINVSHVSSDALQNIAELTCQANDFGYDQAYARLLNSKMHSQDICLVISSSGKSLNLLNAVTVARQKGAAVITFTGFIVDNPLRQLGDLNVWLPSQSYGVVEVGHQLLLHYLCDRLGEVRKG